MNLDIIFVTYNSQKWLDNCINSIVKNKYDLKKISLIFYDNASSDNTLNILSDLKKKYKEKFNDFIIVAGNKNKGFGYGNNKGAKYGKSPYIFFLNVDTELNIDTFSKIEKEIQKSDDKFAIFELAQKPYEHPKYYDPISQETTWSSGACMIIKRDVFESVKGFDEKIFMYCEDVELSWNVRKNGYKIKYLFNVPITHYSYEKPNEFKFTQFVYGFLSNWYIRAKYGKFRNFLRGAQYILYLGYLRRYLPDVDDETKLKIKKLARKTFFCHFLGYAFINLTTSKKKFQPKFVNTLDYELAREGAFYVKPEITTKPLVSILVRTCNRTQALRECLKSIENQTYDNIEIIVMEDGNNNSESMIKKEFSHMNIIYEATKINVGRSRVANLAMAKANGKYLNFLDDDDLFFPDHVETLVSELEKNNYEIVYDGAVETKINVLNNNPYKYEVKEIGLFETRRFSRKRLFNVNLFPIQAVMFRRDLFKECGGIDETIDALEDWDFWIRLSLKHDFHSIKKTTSIFRTPYDQKITEKRNKFLASTLEYLLEKHSTYKPDMSVSDFRE